MDMKKIHIKPGAKMKKETGNYEYERGARLSSIQKDGRRHIGNKTRRL